MRLDMPLDVQVVQSMLRRPHVPLCMVLVILRFSGCAQLGVALVLRTRVRSYAVSIAMHLAMHGDERMLHRPHMALFVVVTMTVGSFILGGSTLVLLCCCCRTCVMLIAMRIDMQAEQSMLHLQCSWS